MRKSLLVLLGMCVAIGVLPAYAQLRAISVTVEVIDSKGQPGAAVLQSSDITLRLPLIAGSLFGRPNTGDILVEQIYVGNTIVLDAERMRNAGARLASPIAPQLTQNGMQVEPRNTRFARFGTFVSDTRTNASIGAGGFVDRETRMGLILVYFEEPCRITGLLRMDGLEAKHDISIPSRGLHWIRVREATNTYYELDYIGVPGDVILGITPPPPPKLGHDT